MSERARLSPVPLILAALLAVAALALSPGPPPPARSAPLGVVAAYRSFDQQGALFALRVKELGRTLAGQRVAQPGHSEHQLGTALDFTSKGMADVTVGWGRSPTGRWAARNAWRFGFVLS